MKRAIFGILAALFLTFVVLIALYANRTVVYHDGRCGTQKWERPVRWLSFGKLEQSGRDYDEFGIVVRWNRAHTTQCDPIWIEGPLGPGASEYWPKLHFLIAANAPLNEIEMEISSTGNEALRSKDVLGRTPLHWASIYPNVQGREKLIKELTAKGLSPDERDSDGLTPADWRRQYESAQ